MFTDDLTGKYFKADHPITCLNPNEYNKITEAHVSWCPTQERIKVMVRGEETMWFSESSILHITDEVEEW